MRSTAQPLLRVLSVVALAFGLSACTLKATLDTTSDGITNFLSSTTPGAWFTSEGLVKDQYKVTAFTTLNFQNLKEDMARGQGEYLTSLGTLIGVPADYQAEFFALAQAKYPFLVSSDRTTLNFQNLKEDMARGQGEYLTSLGTLIGVPADYQAEFFALAQAKYSFLVSSDRTTPVEMLAALNRELSDHPTLHKLGVNN